MIATGIVLGIVFFFNTVNSYIQYGNNLTYTNGFEFVTLANGSQIHITAPLGNSFNSANITYGFDQAGLLTMRRVTLTCVFNDGEVFNKTSADTAGYFSFDVEGNLYSSCDFVVLSGETVQITTTFYLNFTVIPSIPRTPPIIIYKHRTLPTEAEMNIIMNQLNQTQVLFYCGVYTGYPRVSSVSVDCGGRNITVKNFEGPFNLTVTRSLQRIRCVCSADHDSKNYTATSAVIFNILSVPTTAPVIYVRDRIVENGSNYLHTGNASQLNVSCWVSDGNPKVSNVTLTLLVGRDRKEFTSADYEADVTLTLWGHGEAVVECSATHVTGQYHQRSMIFVSFNVSRHAPENKPEVKYQGKYIPDGGNLNYTDVRNSKLSIECRVLGGSPPVSVVILTCGTNSSRSLNDTGLFTISQPKNYDEMQCVCSAVHETGIYSKTTSFTLHVTYQSSVTSIKANGKSDYLFVPKGQNVTITCEANGKPKPQLSLTASRPDNLALGGPVIVNDLKLSRTFLASETSAGTYVCKADNHVEELGTDTSSRSVEVIVGVIAQDLISSFTANGQQLAEIFKNDNITLLCESTSTPLPRLSIRTLPSDSPVSSPSPSFISKTIIAAYNESYQCLALRTNGSITSYEVKNVTVRIKTSASPVVKWNGAYVTEGDNLSIAPKTTDSAGRREEFICFVTDPIRSLKFVCGTANRKVISETNAKIVSLSVSEGLVGRSFTCTCTSTYPSSLTRTTSFHVNSQGAVGQGLLGTLVCVLLSLLTLQ